MTEPLLFEFLEIVFYFSYSFKTCFQLFLFPVLSFFCVKMWRKKKEANTIEANVGLLFYNDSLPQRASDQKYYEELKGNEKKSAEIRLSFY